MVFHIARVYASWKHEKNLQVNEPQSEPCALCSEFAVERRHWLSRWRQLIEIKRCLLTVGRMLISPQFPQQRWHVTEDRDGSMHPGVTAGKGNHQRQKRFVRGAAADSGTAQEGMRYRQPASMPSRVDGDLKLQPRLYCLGEQPITLLKAVLKALSDS